MTMNQEQLKHWREYMREYRKRNSTPIAPEPTIDLTLSQRGYLAGYFDGEGCVFIQKSRRTDSGYNYRLCVRFSQAKPEVVRWIHSVFGGSITPRKRNRRGYDEMYHELTLGSSKARRFLECIRPYVIEKREQVELGFGFYEHLDLFQLRYIDHSQLKHPDLELAQKVRQERDEMYMQMRALKVTQSRSLRDGPVQYAGPPLKLAQAG